jgi:CheY-like chemotaxis protein
LKISGNSQNTEGVCVDGAATKKNILVVEDNPVNQIVAVAHLDFLGFRSELAENGLAALELIRSGRKFALLLMDCQMPVMDGFETTVAIREYEKSANLIRTPIVALTANAMPGDRESCLKAGMDDYITKPFKRASLAAILEKWLK